MARLILKNVRLLYIREKAIFSLIVLCTFLSSILLCFCYGLYCNYIEKKNSQEYELMDLEISFDYSGNMGKENYITAKQIEECVLQFSENITDNVEMFFVRSKEEKTQILLECRFIIRDGKFYPCDVVRDNLVRSGLLENYFTVSHEKEGAQVAIVPGDKEQWRWNNVSLINEMMIDDHHILLQGETYQVVGEHGWADRILLPFASLDEKTVIDEYGLNLSFKQRMTHQQYDEVKAVVEQTLGDVAQVPAKPELDRFLRNLYNTVLIIDILIAGIIALNFAILYQYIILRRKKEMGIFMLCGRNRKQSIIYFILESHSILIPSFIVGVIGYHYLLRPLISWLMPYVQDSYNFLSYATLTVAYLVMSVLIIGISLAVGIKKLSIAEIVHNK